ncbi:MAG: GNAT family N-acetyltransferase [Candidatus Binatia bacterium]
MTRDELILLSDLNMAEAFRDLSRRAGGVVEDRDGLLCFTGAHPLPVLVNGAMRLDDTLGPAEVLARARSFFAAQNRGFTLMLRAHADADLQAVATEAGLADFGSPPAMVIEGRLADAAPGPGVELRRVATPGDVQAFAHVSGGAYATYGMPPDVAPALFGRPEVLLAPHIAAFLAVVDGAPTAAAMILLSHGVGGVYWVGTLPEGRGRGLAELVTRAATNAAFDLGARMVTLQASVMGEPIYRRMGYVEVTRYPQLVQLTMPES